MIEIGKDYQLTFSRWNERHFVYGRADAFEFPVVRIRERGGQTRIVNLASSEFVEAVELLAGPEMDFRDIQVQSFRPRED